MLGIRIAIPRLEGTEWSHGTAHIQVISMPDQEPMYKLLLYWQNPSADGQSGTVPQLTLEENNVDHLGLGWSRSMRASAHYG